MSVGGDGGLTIVAGFEPFGGRRRNQSWEVVRRLAPRRGLLTVRLPVEHARLKAIVPGLAQRASRALLLVGESPNAALSVEQVALNLLDRERADNTGKAPEEETLVAGGPLALKASWDAREVARALRERDIEAEASFHAGTYACNAALYLALHARGGRAGVGFLHVPRSGWSRGTRLDRLVQAISICLGALGGAAMAAGSAE